MLDRVLVPDLWQQQAIAALQDGKDVIVHAPTGAGKTLVFEAWAQYGKLRGRAVYTVPTRALANDKLAEWRGRGWSVGIATGDLSENLDASIIVATLETQKNRLIRGIGPDLLVIDEYQLIGDPDRGLNYEIAIALAPPKTQLLLLSGSVANPEHVAQWLQRLGRDVVVIKHTIRPVPMEEVHPSQLQSYVPKEIRGYWPNLIAKALADDLGPILLFAPRRVGAEKLAASLASALPVPDPLQLTPEQKRLVDPRMARMLQSRIAYHHSGLAYAARAGVIEPLAKAGQLRVVVATMGLAAGINFSLRTVALAADSYSRDNRERSLRPDELLQMFGRAGRRGLDETGYLLLSANEIGLREAAPAALARSGLVDWGALLSIMSAAAESGQDPFAAAVRVQERLFTTRPIALGVEFSIKHPDTPCGLRTDSDRAQHVRRRLRQMLNSRGVWQEFPETIAVPLEQVRMIPKDTPAGSTPTLLSVLAVPELAEHFGRGKLEVISAADAPLEHGRAVTVADRLPNGRLELARWARRLLQVPGHEIKPELWQSKYVPLLERHLAAQGTPVVRYVKHPGKLVAQLSLAALQATVPVDEAGVALWKPPAREIQPEDCARCAQLTACRKLTGSGGTAAQWRRMGLIDAAGVPTRRGRVVSFFTQGDGLAIAAALEDARYPTEELIYDLANLKAGYRFSGDEHRWEGRLAYGCQQAYGRESITGYLENGIPYEYGAGAEQIARSIHLNPANKHEWVGAVAEEGDIDRLIVEWRSLLRRITHAPKLDWPRWTELCQRAADVLDETESPTLTELPPLVYHQTKRVDHRLRLHRH